MSINGFGGSIFLLEGCPVSWGYSIWPFCYLLKHPSTTSATLNLRVPMASSRRFTMMGMMRYSSNYRNSLKAFRNRTSNAIYSRISSNSGSFSCSSFNSAALTQWSSIRHICLAGPPRKKLPKCWRSSFLFWSSSFIPLHHSMWHLNSAEGCRFWWES